MKLRFGSLLALVFLFLFAQKVHADNSQFSISATSEYNIQKDGEANVSQVISITNKTEFYYTPTYTITVGFDDVQNLEAFNSDGSIPTTLSGQNSGKSIKLTFPKRYAGLNKTNTFTLKFTTKDIARLEGSIWEVSVPGIETPDDFDEYKIEINVPDEFGIASIVKPAVKIGNSNTITLSKEQVGKGGVIILFGEKQYYEFHLKYNISNPNLFPVTTEIALPPETGYQNVVISKFSENPINVVKDIDGNWIAEYKLLPQQKKQVLIEGMVEVVANPKREELTSRQLKEYTAGKKYWEQDANIKKIAASLNSVEDIYKFVVATLSYNYSKVATSNLRLGGKGVLADAKNSVCLEFSDLFISLARAKGIPARSVEGYAYTKNTKLRPLSLVNDILHAWPEYYDNSRKVWVMVDPTWGNTTKGMDYFSSLDFSHVAFVRKGMDSEYPIPAGGYKFSKDSRDVEIKFAKAADFRKKRVIQIDDTFPSYSFPKMAINGSFTVKNAGNIPLSDLAVKVTTSKKTNREFMIDYIPPGGVKKITTTFSDVPLLTNETYLITIQVGEQVYKKYIKISFIPDLTILLIIGGIISGSTIIAAITFHTGSLLIQRRKRKNPVRRES